MKTSPYLLLVAAAFTFGMPASGALAQDRPRDTGTAKETARALALPGGTPRYVVTYAASSTLPVNTLRSASIVSVTNQSPVSCRVAVIWRLGFGGVSCETGDLLGPGFTLDFCTRPLPDDLTTCNGVCPDAGLTVFEGNAVVGSSTTTGCERIAVSARTVYTANANDLSISAITDAKVVRFGQGNIGD